MIRDYAVGIFVHLLLAFTAAGQGDGAMPKLYPSSVTVYDIDRGMPISCVENMFVGPKGRLFISPCRYQDIYQSMSFYLYDGDKSHTVTLEAPGGKAGPFSWYLKGCTEGGFLFGVDAKNTHGFLYNPVNGSKQIVSFDSTESVRNMIAGSGNEVYLLTCSSGIYALYRLTPENRKLLRRVPVTGEPGANFSGDIPMCRSGDHLFFSLSDSGFVRYSLADNSLKEYKWKALMGSSFRESPNTSPDLNFTGLNLAVVPGGKLLFYLRSYGGFFVFDPQNEQVTRQVQLNGYLRQFNTTNRFSVNFYQDKRQNVLVHFAREPQPGMQKNSDLTAAVLWDQDGQFFDYTPVAKMAAAGRYNVSPGDFMYSQNFKKQVLIATGGGMIAVEVKASLPVKTGLKGWASRAMGELDKNRVLVMSESGNKAILNLSTMQATVLKCRMSSDLWCKGRNYVQLVSKNGQLWIPFEGGRLASYNSVNQSFQYYNVGQEFDKFNFIRPREIAIVNTQNELYRYNLDQGKLSAFLKDGAPLQIGGTANELVVDKNGTLWIASLNGLWRIDPQTGASKRYGKADGLVDDQFLCIHEAEDGELWIGTLGGGVQFINPKTGALRVLNQSAGLSNNSVVGILADAGGDRWISTFDGLTVVSPKGTVLFKLSEEDGLAHREFNRYSYLKTSDGRLLFGGVDGITILEPEKIKSAFTQTEPLRIYLTDIGYYDKNQGAEVYQTNRFEQLKRIVLPAAHRYIKLDFGLSDFISPEKSTFSYRISHDNDNPANDKEAIWTNIGSSSELLLNDLPVGSYTILIRGINAKGQWTETPLAIPVTVQEFFYKTWWFYLLCSLPFLLGAYFWIRRLQTERQRLEAEVAARTQQIRHDKELIEKQAVKLQELDEMKSRFFTNISHEFRTPLTVISGMVTQIRKQPGQWLEKGLELIQRNSTQLLTLINQILDLQKLESGALKVHLVQGDVVPYLRYIAESFVQLAQSKGIRIHVLANADKVHMDYDSDKMMHILSNLLSNAIKYTPSTGGDIYLQIDRHSHEGLDQLYIQVKDTGQGIAPEALPYIFDRFYQVEDLATQKPQGSGVGLALTKELVKLLNGTIEVASTPGAGTTFSLAFPITREAPVQGNMPAPVVPAQAPPVSVPENAPEAPVPAELASEEISTQTEDVTSDLHTLLIVEDNPDVRLYLTAFLEKDYHLLLAKDGQEGIDIAIEQVPDLIVSDVMMPVKDGFALCDTLKNDGRTSHIPIVLLTAKADFESRLSGLRRGADAYLTKPFEQDELLVRLEQLLALRKKLQERYRNPTFAGQEPGPEAAEMEDAFILKLRQLVLDHLSEEDYGIVHLCRALGVGRTQLHNKLKALTDRSTSEFIRSVRLNKARELLQTTDMNVSEVSYEIGISNPAYFSRIYTEEFGEAPRETRR